jgi:DNA-binding response OmpR family regulator
MKTLVADDDPLIRLLHTTALQQRGHEVFEAEDGDVAWEVIEREQPALVILDWQMPRLDGLAVCRRLREFAPTRDTFVLVVTARDGEDDLLSALDAGVDDYLSKPFTPEALMARLHIAERRIAVTAAHRRADAALQEARYLAGIGQTVVAVQHEINNPLASMMGNAQLLQHGLVNAEEQPRVIADILTQVTRIADVLRRLRDIDVPRTVEYVEGVQMLDLYGHDGPRV